MNWRHCVGCDIKFTNEDGNDCPFCTGVTVGCYQPDVKKMDLNLLDFLDWRDFPARDEWATDPVAA